LDHFDRGDHATDDAVEYLLPADIVIIARWRSQIVGNEDIGLGACREQRRLAFGACDVGGDRDRFGSGSLADLSRGRLRAFAAATVDDDVTAGFRQFLRASTAQTFA